MWALVKSGSIDTIYGGARAITIGDIKYPKGMFTLYSTAEKKSIGIYDIVRKDQPDSNFYDVSDSTFVYDADTDTVNETFNITERDLDKLKEPALLAANTGAYGRIESFAWLVQRYSYDNSKAIPDEVKTYVATVRSHCATICTAINGCSDLAAFKVVYAKIYDDDGEYNTGWPDRSGLTSYHRGITLI